MKVKNSRLTLSSAIVRVAGSCPRGTSLLLDTSTLLPSQPIESDLVAGFVRIDQTGARKSFGGSSTTNVTTTRLGAGFYSARFSGNFSELNVADTQENRDRVTVLATAAGGFFEVANARVVSANSAEIVVNFTTWRSPTLTTLDSAGAYVAVLIGKTS